MHCGSHTLVTAIESKRMHGGCKRDLVTRGLPPYALLLYSAGIAEVHPLNQRLGSTLRCFPLESFQQEGGRGPPRVVKGRPRSPISILTFFEPSVRSP